MEYIFDFNQAKITSIVGIDCGKEVRLDMNDILILDYIITAYCSTTMTHIVIDNVEYVWINRTKLLADLPILNISPNRLTRLFDKLSFLGLINKVQYATPKQKGSKCYFSPTELLTSCLNNECDRYYRLLGVENNTSNISNTISINTKENIEYVDISEVLKITPNKIQKKSLFDICSDLVKSRISNQTLSDLLIKYLSVRMNIKDKPFSVDKWISIINKLIELSDSDTIRLKIVQQSIDNKWASVFSLRENRYSIQSLPNNRNVHSVSMTEEDKIQLQKSIEERRARGEQVEF